MEDTISLLKSECSSEPSVSLEDAQLWDCRRDVFEHQHNTATSLETIAIRKDKVSECGHVKFIRRVFVKHPEAREYANVGWVVDGDVEACMVCATYFSFFNGRHHCRICGDISCRDCSTSELLITEFRDFGPVRACDQCYYGQVRLVCWCAGVLAWISQYFADAQW
jgi:hypothetical protein